MSLAVWRLPVARVSLYLDGLHQAGLGLSQLILF